MTSSPRRANSRTNARERRYPHESLIGVDNIVVNSVSQRLGKTDRYSVDVLHPVAGPIRLVLSDEAVLRLGVRVGATLAAPAMAAESESVMANDLAMAALARRGHGAVELERLLVRRGISRSVAVATVARLTRVGLVDDAEFASAFARSRLSARGASLWSLRRDLGKRGVDRAIADAAISAALDHSGVSEAEVALRVAEKRWKSLSALDRTVGMRRLVGFLQRRGFGGDTIRTVLAKMSVIARR